VLAAVQWVAARPEVDAGRIAMAGSSFGGVLTVLALSEPAPSLAGPTSSTWVVTAGWRARVRRETATARTDNRR